MIHLVVHSDLTVPDEVDGLEVTVTASETAEPKTCRPETFSLELQGLAGERGEAWPLRVAVQEGDRFSAWLAFRFVATSLGEEVLLREGRAPWPESGYRELEVELSSDCLRRSCGDNEHCIDGLCRGVPEPDVFDDRYADEESEPCVEQGR